MQLIKFITKENDEYICWAATNTLKGFRDTMQFILDNFNEPKQTMILDTNNNKVYDFYNIATKQYHMRKRTLMERLSNIQTGNWNNIKL